MNPTPEMLIKQLVAYYRSYFKEGASPTVEERIGLAIAHYFDGDGLSILKTCYSALEDANFHKENETIQMLIDNLKN